MKLGKDFFLWGQFIVALFQLFVEIFGDKDDPPKAKK